jgi:hypothetical protein
MSIYFPTCAIRVLSVCVCSGLLLSCGVGGTAGSGKQSAKLTQILITPDNSMLAKGTSLQLSATGIFDDGSKQALTALAVWTTNPAAVATINRQGELAAAGLGVAQVSAAYQGMEGSTSVTVGPPRLDSVTVSASQSSLPLGESEQLTAVGTFSDGTTQNLTHSATWSSSGPAIAGVSQAGIAAAAAVGAVTISATSGSVTGSASLTVTSAAVIAVNILPPALSMSLGSNRQLQAMATFSDGSKQALTSSVTWQTSQPAVSTISTQGEVTAAGLGTAQVSAAYQGLTGVTSITVGPAALVSIAVGPNRSSLPIGESEQITATGTFSDGTTQNLTHSATWSSSGSAIASVSQAGIAAAVAVGTVAISATSASVTGSANLTVTSAAVIAVNIIPPALSMSLGSNRQLQAMATFSDGSKQALSSSVTWQTSQPAVSTVSTQGEVTAAGLGAAQVSAAYQGLTGVTSITVGPAALVSIAVGPNRPSLPIGESEQITATGTFSDGTTRSLAQSAIWSSSGSAIASVSQAGIAAAHALGTVTISATSGSVTGSANLTVTSAAVIAVNIIPATVSMVLGSSRQLQAMAMLSDGTIQDMTATVAWSSAQPDIAIVNAGGLTVAEQVGSTTILAEGSGITGSAILAVVPLVTVDYFDRASSVQSGVDGSVQLINPGGTAGSLCAMVYVLDQNQVLSECCGCSISDSGLRSMSLLRDLTANPLTGKKPQAGVIMVVPSNPGQNAQCDAGSLSPNGLILGWGTEVQSLPDNAFQVAETSFSLSPLSGGARQRVQLYRAGRQRQGHLFLRDW